MVHQLRTRAARALAALAILALCVGAFPSSSLYPGFVPPAVGGVNATLFADFRTEGSANHYWYNGKQYLGEVAWLTAVSGTFARSTSATYTNSSGLLATAAINALRFDYDPITLSSKGILLESASTNIFTQSVDLTNAAWATTPRVTATGGQSAPDGTTSAILLADNTTTSGAYYIISQGLTTTIGVTYSVSVYAKQQNYRYLVFGNQQGPFSSAVFDMQTQTVVSATGEGGVGSVTPGPAGFFRYTLTYTASGTTPSWSFGANSTGDVSRVLANGVGVNGNGVYLFGPQIEALSFASSYIRTTTVAVTRTADTLSLPISAYVAGPVTILASVTFSGWSTFGGIIGTNGSGNPAPLLQSNVDASHFVTANGAQNLSGPALGSDVTHPHTVAAAGDGSARRITADGLTPTSDANAFWGASVTTATFGLAGGSVNSYGDYAKFGLWPVAATTGQLQALTQ